MPGVMYIIAPGLPTRLAQIFSARPQLVRALPLIPAEGAEQRTEPDPGGLYGFLLKKWYFDELYDWLFVRPAMVIGDGLWRSGDGAVIDGLGPNGVAAITRDLARQACRLQTGYLYHYAFAMMIGLVALVTWYLFPR